MARSPRKKPTPSSFGRAKDRTAAKALAATVAGLEQRLASNEAELTAAQLTTKTQGERIEGLIAENRALIAKVQEDIVVVPRDPINPKLVPIGWDFKVTGRDRMGLIETFTATPRKA